MSKDGGPAFPLNTPKWHERVSDQGSSGVVDFTMGMTLRDYFAAKAMAAVIQTWPQVQDSSIKSEDELLRVTAEDAYRFADAMLAARAKP